MNVGPPMGKAEPQLPLRLRVASRRSNSSKSDTGQRVYSQKNEKVDSATVIVRDGQKYREIQR
jgi:hypothetical protein